MSTGTLYGVSVGPGDPELLTTKALRVIAASPVIAVPRTHGRNTHALDIVQQVISLEGKELLYLEHRMVSNQSILEQQYAENTRQIIEALERGLDVALLNLGDISIYSTCSYLMERVKKKGYTYRMIPGVPSFCACAALTGEALVQWDEPLHIYPGSYSDLDTALEVDGCRVLMKPARSLPQIREKIHDKGLQNRTIVVSDCGMPGEKLCSIDDDTTTSYFTTLIIKD